MCKNVVKQTVCTCFAKVLWLVVKCL
jgi:hypothetical protein